MPGQFLGRGMGGLMSSGVASGNGLLANLVAYWGLDEAAGANNALDKHSNALALTQNSNPGSDTGKVYAGARTFDGSAQRFSRTSESLLQVSSATDFTTAAWIYPTATVNNSTIVGKLNEQWIAYWSTTGKVTVFLGPSGNNVSTTKAWALNEWTLFVVYWNATTKKLGISADGGAPNEADLSAIADWSATANVFGIGARSGALHWTGRIGPVAFWKSAAGGGGVLSAAQRTALYNAGNGLAYASFTA